MNKNIETKIKCPSCKGTLIKYSWGYGCSGYQEGCRFSVGAVCGKILTVRQVEKLIKKGNTGIITGFQKRDGSSFDAALELKKDDSENYRVTFEKQNYIKEEMPDLYAVCPYCKERITRKLKGWGCEEKCGIFLPYEFSGRRFTKREAECLFGEKETPLLSGFVSKKKKPFAAVFYIEENHVKMRFPEKSQSAEEE